MNDRGLANRIVKLGVRDGGNGQYYAELGINDRWLTASEFVRDWRVAGAMMEKAQAAGLEIVILRNGVQVAHPKWSGYEWSGDESLPRAINLACIEALGERDE